MTDTTVRTSRTEYNHERAKTAHEDERTRCPECGGCLISALGLPENVRETASVI